MILRIKGFELEIAIEEELYPVLVVLDKAIFRSIVKSLYDNIKGFENNDIVIEDDEKIIKYSKRVICLDEYFNIDFKAKEIISKLYKRIEESINDDMEVKMKIEQEIKELGQLLYRMADDIDFGISYDSDIKLANMLKVFNFQIDALEIVSTIDKLLSLIHIISDFKIADLIVFINLKAYFSNKEVTEIYKCLKYKKLKFICIEAQLCDKINEESLYLIDEDLVETGYTK